MTRNRIGAMLAVVILAVAAPIVALGLLRTIGGTAEAQAPLSFTEIIDEGNVPSDPGVTYLMPFGTPPLNNDCLLGSPCEMEFDLDQPVLNPLHAITANVPNPDGAFGGLGFDIANGYTGLTGNGAPPLDDETAGAGLTNGSLAGWTNFLITLDLGAGCNFAYSAGISLYDGALPGSSSGFYPNGNFVEGPDDGTAPALINPLVWPNRLEADPVLAGLVGAGGIVWARYVGFDPTGGTPVNVLVVHMGSAGYEQVAILGDPTAPPSTPMCTPFEVDADFLGETTDSGSGLTEQLRRCTEVNTHTFSATFTPAVGEPTVLYDTGTCSALETDLEKVDLQVRPFYCGDSDMDGDEATGLQVPTGAGTCCDGVDNDGDTATDGMDQKCAAFMNEDGGPPGFGAWGVDDDGDGLFDEDPYVYYLGLASPWNGDDDGDGWVDEDPKNNHDDDDDYIIPFSDCLPPAPGCDEDPANGFLGIDNDADGQPDEDGSGRFDFDGDTMIAGCVGLPPDRFCEDQLEGWDDDGDTQVDEDPLDSPVAFTPALEPAPKWVQPPDLEFGADVMATWFDDMPSGFALADDYLCTTTGPITDIYFWGSWLDDIFPGDPNIVSFTLSIHSDVPGPPYSHPGATLWMHQYLPGECVVVNAIPTTEEFVDPSGDHMGWDTTAFKYRCPGPDPEEFIQEGTVESPVVYWLNIQAHLNYFPLPVFFGWKTSTEQWNDFPVFASVPKPPEIDPGAWMPTWIGADLAFEIWGLEEQPARIHEPHYLVKEILLNRGPETWVTATDTKEIDAPTWRAGDLEDGLTTCNDGQDNDADTLVDLEDFSCLDPHIGEEAPGIHSCNDGIDNGLDGPADEEDEDCQTTLTEVSVECSNPDDLITVKGNVPLYIKPPSNYYVPECEEYYDPAHFNKCVPCKVLVGVTPPEGLSFHCSDLLGTYEPGFCVAVDSVPGVYKELDLHQEVDLGYRTHNLHLIEPPGVTDPAALGNPLYSLWYELYPMYTQEWELTSWEDNLEYDPNASEDGAGLWTCSDGIDNGGDDDFDEGDFDCFGNEVLSYNDQIDMVLYEPDGEPDGDGGSYEKAWFHVELVTQTVWLDFYNPEFPEFDQLTEPADKYIEPMGPPVSITLPLSGPWLEKWPEYSVPCEVIDWFDSGAIPGVLDPSDWLLIPACGTQPPGFYHVGGVSIDVWLSQKVVDEHQFDLSCEGPPSLHKFTIQNELQPVEPVWDPNPYNNAKETQMGVACIAAAEATVTDLTVPLPDDMGTAWHVNVSHAESTSVSVNATNNGPTAADFVVSLEEESPGLWYAGIPPADDQDSDGWVDKIEDILGSDSNSDTSMPENLHAAGTCNDGIDNDGWFGQDAADFKCWDSDGDGYSDLYEVIFGSNPGDFTSTPEHMQYPWSCADGIDNDGDGFTDGAEGSTVPTGESAGDGNNFADCSYEELGGLSPPVYCASGWVYNQGAPGVGDSQYVYVGPNGTLTVGLNIPVSNLLGTTPIARDLILHCFEPESPYPTETVRASIAPANSHVIDGNPYNNGDETTFDGDATCVLGETTLDIVSWVFNPTGVDGNFHPNEEQIFATTKTIRNSGPADPVNVRVRKYINVPTGCDGSLEISPDLETVFIAEGLEYNVNQGHEPAGGWLTAPPGGIELTPPQGQTVYVQGEPLPFPQDQAELFAHFVVSVPKNPPGLDVTVAENFDIYCRETGTKSFEFSNQITAADYPDVCMTDLGNIRIDNAMSVEVKPDADEDTWADENDNCPDDPNPIQENYDGHHKGDVCDDDDDDDGWDDDEEVPGGGGANPAQDTQGSDYHNINSTPEVCDGLDNDGNEGVDEGFPDQNGDNEADCVEDDAGECTAPHADCDVDGDGQLNGPDPDCDDATNGAHFLDLAENYHGTDPCTKCGQDNDPYDTAPLYGAAINTLDLFAFVLGEAIGGAINNDNTYGLYDNRLDLRQGIGQTGVINTLDLFVYINRGILGDTCGVDY